MTVEGTGTGMHGGSNHIGLESQQKLAHLVICLRTDIAQFLLEITLGPCLHAPVLIVDKDTAVFYGWFFRHIIFSIFRRIIMLYRNVCPPVPWTYSDGLGYAEHTVGESARIGTGHLYPAVRCPDGKGFPLSGQAFI